ncbi:MAG: diguanylate cyclase [Chloroflexi bacterium]|nr:diguanylate cyclase [Chloroflexota bacterium]
MKTPTDRRRPGLEYRRQHFFHFLDQRSRAFWALLGLPLTLVVAWADLLTGYEYAFSLFYLAPISLSAWYAGRRVGVPMAILSGFMWVAADVLTRQSYLSQTVIIWNTVIRTSVFLLVGLLVADLRRAIRAERRLSQTDGTTGASNARYFQSFLKWEIDRAARFGHPFTLAFIDLDNFKQVNDTYGHLKGDEVLQAFAVAAQRGLRRSDLLGRLGGDEFTILLPELDETPARETLERVREAAAAELDSLGVHITFSIGAVTFLRSPGEPDRAIQLADHLMYEAKNTGKNQIRMAVFPPAGD